MRTLVIASGHLQSTVKSANMIADKLSDVDVFDTNSKPDFDFSLYDNFVFGTNIRIFSINKRFKKWAKKLKKFYATQKVYAYLVCLNERGLNQYIAKIKKIIPQVICVSYFGGELDATYATGMAKKIIEKIRSSVIEGKEEFPSLNEAEIEKFANMIKNNF